MKEAHLNLKPMPVNEKTQQLKQQLLFIQAAAARLSAFNLKQPHTNRHHPIPGRIAAITPAVKPKPDVNRIQPGVPIFAPFMRILMLYTHGIIAKLLLNQNPHAKLSMQNPLPDSKIIKRFDLKPRIDV